MWLWCESFSEECDGITKIWGKPILALHCSESDDVVDGNHTFSFLTVQGLGLNPKPVHLNHRAQLEKTVGLDSRPHSYFHTNNTILTLCLIKYQSTPEIKSKTWYVLLRNLTSE